MNLDIVSCIAEFSHADTLMIMKEVDVEYEDICERNMKQSEEALIRILQTGSMKQLMEYVSRYPITGKDTCYAKFCSTPIMFEYFYDGEQDPSSFIQYFMDNYDMIRYLHIKYKVKLGNVVEDEHLAYTSYLLETSDDTTISLYLTYDEYNNEILDLILKYHDKIKSFEDCFKYNNDEVRNTCNDILDKIIDIIILRSMNVFECTYEIIRRFIELYLNTSGSTYKVPENIFKCIDNNEAYYKGDCDRIIDLLELYVPENLQTYIFVADGKYEVINYLLNLNYEIVFRLDYGCKISHRFLQRIKDKGKLRVQLPNTYQNLPIYPIEVGDVIKDIVEYI